MSSLQRFIESSIVWHGVEVRSSADFFTDDLFPKNSYCCARDWLAVNDNSSVLSSALPEVPAPNEPAPPFFNPEVSNPEVPAPKPTTVPQPDQQPDPEGAPPPSAANDTHIVNNKIAADRDRFFNLDFLKGILSAAFNRR